MEISRRILLVEDDPAWQKKLMAMIESEGYAVDGAASYGEALGKLRRKPFDLAVIDLRLVSSMDEENLDGMALLDDVLERGVPAIIVTGYGTPKLIDEAYEAYNVFGFVEKARFDTQSFKEYIKEAIAARETPHVREPLTPEQKKKFKETVRKIFRGEAVTFGRSAE